MSDRAENKGQMADQQFEEQVKEWKSIIKGQDKRLEGLLNTAFQLANYYFVFQGVILAAIANGKSLACENRWFLFTLSLLAIILNLCALIVTGTKYVKSSRQRHETWTLYSLAMEDEERRRCQPCQPQETARTDNVMRDVCSEIKQRVLFASCVLLFLVFAGVTLAGCLWISCHHINDDDDKNTRYDNNARRNCIQICDGFKCMKFCS